MDNSITEKSPAKINLFLKILNRREDNYHNIRTGITSINLCDEIEVKPSNQFNVEYNGAFAPENNIFDGFELYGSLDGLYSMFANESLLLIFWLHFLAISLCAGSWIIRDAQRYFIPKIITIPSLILTYFTGPVGILVYWFFRIFFAKKISFND